MAKKTARKKAANPAARKASNRTAKKTPARGTARKAAARKAARPTARKRTSKAAVSRRTSRTARKKTAARGAATRKRRSTPAPKAPSRMASAAAAARGTLAGAVAAVAARMQWNTAEPDAIQLLEQEHRRFEELMKQGEDTTERARQTRRELLITLAAELNAHELMEEKVLYPALQSHPEARAIVLEGYQEHHVADLILNELRDVAADDEQWAAKFKVLKENVEHHIKEEESEMFRTARGIFSREELQDLAERMLALKKRSGAARTAG